MAKIHLKKKHSPMKSQLCPLIPRIPVLTSFQLRPMRTDGPLGELRSIFRRKQANVIG